MLVAGRPVTQLLSLQTLQRGECGHSLPPAALQTLGLCGRIPMNAAARLEAPLPAAACRRHCLLPFGPASQRHLLCCVHPMHLQAWPACPKRCAQGSTS